MRVEPAAEHALLHRGRLCAVVARVRCALSAHTLQPAAARKDGSRPATARPAAKLRGVPRRAEAARRHGHATRGGGRAARAAGQGDAGPEGAPRAREEARRLLAEVRRGGQAIGRAQGPRGASGAPRPAPGITGSAGLPADAG